MKMPVSNEMMVTSPRVSSSAIPPGFDSLDVAVLLIDVVLAPVRCTSTSALSASSSREEANAEM
jgi:hypothetical protein